MWRFIAGAICPQCKEFDRLQVRYQKERYLCRCVNCDYQSNLDENADLNNKQIPITNLQD